MDQHRRYSRRNNAVSIVPQLYRQFVLAALFLQGVSAGFIDSDTPLDKRQTNSLVDGTEYHLVMSDEFNVPNRTFTDGHDPVWTALDKPDDDSSAAGGGSQQFYNSSFVTTTEDGMLKISTKIGKTKWTRYDQVKKEWKEDSANFKSGMVQSWEKFCFTGGIIEVDVVFPGDPYIGGLWPAIWMLGNLGRATYEASTNNIWPWSFDTCDRDLQQAQTISACNVENHFGMNQFQGRGATEIDIVEVMTGDSNGPLPATKPPIELPYADMTLQVAPGVKTNRPASGAAPLFEDTVTPNGHTQLLANSWYRDLELHGNTSINPFFYGTFLGVTKPNEPVSRTKKQAFQADAVGAAHQLAESHFDNVHTFRVEWQPGPGGRIDWYSKGYRVNDTTFMTGDGLGTEWVHAYGITDEILKKTTGAQIPMEPSYLIMNTAVSSTWGFPYDISEDKCYDCEDPKCAGYFAPGFCEMLRKHDVAMYIDSVRVYQSTDPSRGANHTLGCDPPDFPTKEWIKGHSYRYMRNAPFSYEDTGPIKRVQRGGGACRTDKDCGGDRSTENLTAVFEGSPAQDGRNLGEKGFGKCVDSLELNFMIFTKGNPAKVCQCNPGHTGPHCLAQAHFDSAPSAYEMHQKHGIFKSVPSLRFTPFMMFIVLALVVQTIAVGCYVTAEKKKSVEPTEPSVTPGQPRVEVSFEASNIGGANM